MRRSNTVKCPLDGERLHWELHLGMRISRTDSRGVEYYDTICPKCKRHWRVKKAKPK